MRPRSLLHRPGDVDEHDDAALPQTAPAAAQLYALAAFVPFLRRLYGVPLTEVLTHGELGVTSCPG